MNKKLLVRNSPRTEHRHSCEKPNLGHLGAAGAGPGSPTVWRTARPHVPKRARGADESRLQSSSLDEETQRQVHAEA